MGKFLQKLFNLYPGEERNALIFSLLGFLWAFAMTSGQQFADALFLIHVGAASLPLAYSLTAGGMLMMAFAFLHAIHRLGTFHSFILIILIGVIFYAFTAACVWLGFVSKAPWFWFSLKVSSYILYAFGLTSYWTFVDEYYDIRDAKRMYTLFLSMVFLGSAMTGALMRSAILRLETLLPLILCLFIASGLFVRWIQRHVPLFIHEESAQEMAHSGQSFALFSLVQSIVKSRFTLLLLCGNFLMQLLMVLTEFNYLSAFAKAFVPLEKGPIPVGEGTEALLTRFLGQLYASVGIFKLLIGFFLYSRLIRRFGLGALLPCSSLLLLAIYFGWFATSSLIVPIFAFFVIEGTINVIDDNNFNLLLNAVPTKLKYKIRVAIEAFFEPIGMLVSSLILLVFDQKSKPIALVLSGFWLLVILAVRKEYLKGIFRNLAENSIRFSRSVKSWFSTFSSKEKQISEDCLLVLLEEGDSEQRLTAAKGLLNLQNSSLLPKLLRRIARFSTAEKKQFLPLLERSCFHTHPETLRFLTRMLEKEEDAELVGMLQFYFASLGLPFLKKSKKVLGQEHLLSRAAMIASLKKSTHDISLQTVIENRTVATLGLHRFLGATGEEEICIGLRIVAIDASASDVDLLLPFLRHELVSVARCAAEGIFKIIDKTCRRQARILIERLQEVKDSVVRAYCLRALGKLGDSSYAKAMILGSIHFRPNERRLVEKLIVDMGLKTVPMLLALTKDETHSDRCRVLAGRILGRLALPQLHANLHEIISAEIDRAYFYFYHAETLSEEYPDLDLSILIDALKTGYDSVIDFMMQILAVAGEVEDEEILSRSLRSLNPKIRSQAIEALERTCDPAIFKHIEPLIEDLPMEEKKKWYDARIKKTWNLSELLDKLDTSPAQADQIIAATFKYRLNLPGWRESLRRKMLCQEEIFHHFAYELLEQ